MKIDKVFCIHCGREIYLDINQRERFWDGSEIYSGDCHCLTFMMLTQKYYGYGIDTDKSGELREQRIAWDKYRVTFIYGLSHREGSPRSMENVAQRVHIWVMDKKRRYLMKAHEVRIDLKELKFHPFDFEELKKWVARVCLMS